MPTPNALQKQTILDDLVNQFSDPLSFFRELIQNSIDAGSGQIEVSFELESGEGGDAGTMIIHVDDFGEGMNREIIETRLTRLFSSAKDDDYTKIGKFGIGFVSVFAIEPDAVCVDTGRTGQSWRVLFSADKTYELYQLDQPVEGTQIRLFKQATREEFDNFVERARQVILHWCKHVPVPIYFDGKELEEPFDIDSLCKIEHVEEGTRLVMGFVDVFEAPFGYYNRGLTLKEGKESPWPHIAFKIDSRYLEHTLTRDQILEDKNFHKAWRLLERLAEEELPEKLVDLIEQAATSPERAAEYEQLHTHLLAWQKAGGQISKQWERRPLFATVDGRAVSMRKIRRHAKSDQVSRAPEYTTLTARLDPNHLVLRAANGSPVPELLSRHLGFLPTCASEHFVFAAEGPPAHTAGAEELTEQLALLLRQLGGAPDWIRLHAFADGEAGSERLALPLEDRHVPTPLSDVPTCSEASLRKTRELVLNLCDERVAKLVRLAREEPEWAAYTLLKLMLLEDGLRPALDNLLVTSAIERRQRHQS